MDANDVIEALNGVLGLGDALDNNGIGILQASDYEHSTRDVIKLELGSYLIYIGDGGLTFTDGQAALVNLCLADRYGEIPSWQMKSIAAELNTPDPKNLSSYAAFENADKNLTEENGTSSHKMTDVLIDLFESFGRLMVTFNQNTQSQIRYEQYISGLKARQAASGLSSSASSGAIYSKQGDDSNPVKESSAKKTSMAASGKSGKYVFNDQVTFALPKGYIHDDVDDGNGGTRNSIRYGRSEDENGKEHWEFDCSVFVGSEGDMEGTRKKNEDIMDFFRRTMQDVIISKSINDPELIIFANKKPVRLFGALLKYKVDGIMRKMDSDHVLSLQIALQQDEDDPSKEINLLKHLIKIAKVTSVNGNKKDFAGLDPKKLVKELKFEFDEEKDESVVNLKVGIKLNINGEERDAGEINLSEMPKHDDKDGLPDVPYLSDKYHEHYTIVTSGSYTSHRDADYRAQPIRELMEKYGSTDEDAYELMKIEGDSYDLDQAGMKLAKVFRMNRNLFDPYNDTEALIRKGMFKDVRMLHALRSLAWIVQKVAVTNGTDTRTIGYDKLETIGEYIEENDYLVYDPLECCQGLNSHYDWHVFFAPDDYIDSDVYLDTDLRYLTGKENRGGNTSFMVMGGDLGAMRRMNAISTMIGRNEETVESLEDLRSDLKGLKPVMETIHDGLLEGRDRNEKLEGPLADALTAWCALTIAAKEPFYSEEAADSDEANAGLEGPLDYPSDDLDDKPVNTKIIKKSTVKTAPKKSESKPAGDVLDLDGATVIEPGQFAGNMALRNIVIPEGVTEIGDQAFYTCMMLESVVFPSTMKKIGKMAFMSCRNLKRVELNDGLEEIEDHAFGATNNLKEVHLPDSLQKVNQNLFGFGGDSPYATAYMSGDLAHRLTDEYLKSGGWDMVSAINARHYVIDGVGYEDMKDYCKPQKSSSGSSGIADSKTTEEYRKEMEKACKEGKSLQDMIDAGRKAIEADDYSDKDAFENAIANLDRNATVTIPGKHFVLSGFGSCEEDVIAEIEKHGGSVHDKMVKMADYLVVCLESPGAAKVKKALEWRQKGAQNLIVSDYQLWQAVLGETEAVASGETAAKKIATSKNKKSSEKASSTPTANIASKSTETDNAKPIQMNTEENDNSVRILDLNGATTIEDFKYRDDSDERPLEIPEGVIRIGRSAFMYANMSSVKLPRSLRIIDDWAFEGCEHLASVEIQEGLEKIGFHAFGYCPKLMSIKLPSSIKEVALSAFIRKPGIDLSSYITIQIPGTAVRDVVKNKSLKGVSAVDAAGFMIDGRRYPTLENYLDTVEAEEKERIERERAEKREREERERREREEHEQQERQRLEDEQRRERQRSDLENLIRQLKQERDSLKGLFAGMKRKKIQKEIDALTEQLRRI